MSFHCKVEARRWPTSGIEITPTRSRWTTAGATGRNPTIYGIKCPARIVASYTTASASTLGMCQSGQSGRWPLPQVELGRPRHHGEVQEKHLEALHHVDDKSQCASSEQRQAACSAPTRRTSCCPLGNTNPRQHANRKRHRHT